MTHYKYCKISMGKRGRGGSFLATWIVQACGDSKVHKSYMVTKFISYLNLYDS